PPSIRTLADVLEPFLPTGFRPCLLASRGAILSLAAGAVTVRAAQVAAIPNIAEVPRRNADSTALKTRVDLSGCIHISPCLPSPAAWPSMGLEAAGFGCC